MFQHHKTPDLTQEDVERTLELVRALPASQTAETAENPAQVFKQFAAQVVELAKAGILSPMEASYAIAGYYMSIDIDDPEGIIIGDLACELEVPETVSGKNAETGWKRLVTLTTK